MSSSRLANSWSDAGRDHLAAAVLLRRSGHVRSAINRAYFSGYTFSHSVLARLGSTLPEKGNWSHRDLPVVLANALKKRAGRKNQWRAVALDRQRDLSECREFRVIADYRPLAILTTEDADFTLRCARKLEKLLLEE